MKCNLVPYVTGVKNGQSDQYTNVYYAKRGNTVMLTLYNFRGTAGQTYTLTGLPTPYQYCIARFINDSGYLGYLEWDLTQWKLYCNSGSAIYGSMTYLTDD